MTMKTFEDGVLTVGRLFNHKMYRVKKTITDNSADKLFYWLELLEQLDEKTFIMMAGMES